MPGSNGPNMNKTMEKRSNRSNIEQSRSSAHSRARHPVPFPGVAGFWGEGKGKPKEERQRGGCRKKAGVKAASMSQTRGSPRSCVRFNSWVGVLLTGQCGCPNSCIQFSRTNLQLDRGMFWACVFIFAVYPFSPSGLRITHLSLKVDWGQPPNPIYF